MKTPPIHNQKRELVKNGRQLCRPDGNIIDIFSCWKWRSVTHEQLGSATGLEAVETCFWLMDEFFFELFVPSKLFLQQGDGTYSLEKQKRKNKKEEFDSSSN